MSDLQHAFVINGFAGDWNRKQQVLYEGRVDNDMMARVQVTYWESLEFLVIDEPFLDLYRCP